MNSLSTALSVYTLYMFIWLLYRVLEENNTKHKRVDKIYISQNKNLDTEIIL
jgi:hypothetical protein